MSKIPAYAWAILFLALILVTYLLSSVSYFVVTFNEPMTTQQFLKYLDDSKINPVENKVYVLNCALSQPEGISNLDFVDKKGKIINDAVFNTKPYALRALFDSKVKTWRFTGPRHPYD